MARGVLVRHCNTISNLRNVKENSDIHRKSPGSDLMELSTLSAVIKIHNISIHGVQIRRSSILTCGDVNVCDIHSVTQGQGNAAVAQDAP